MRVIGACVSVVIGLAFPCLCSAQIPSAYQDLYSQLNGDVSDFHGTITSDVGAS